MSSRPIHLAIDARPRGPSGLLAAEVVLGRAMIGHLAALALELAPEGEPVAVHARPEEHGELAALLDDRARSRLVLQAGPPRADAAVLRTDRFYDRSRLRRRLGRGGSPESAVLWRLDGPESLRSADEELTRRLTYQPIGRYWAFPIAERLAEWLRPTRIRPNAVTMTAAGLMLAAAAAVAAGVPGRAAALVLAWAMAIALVLDTADGRLARLQGTSSAFGRWLDEFLDEMVNLVLHAAIAWSAFVRDGRPVWLMLGIAYASGKYLFRVQSSPGEELESHGTLPGTGQAADTPRSPGTLARVVRLLGHADLRWHLWIVLAAVRRLDIALAAYAVYFPVRTLAAAIRKGWHMREPRISVLVVARDEAHNLADCLAAAQWADERVVVVDSASRDATLEIARRAADRVAVRVFDDFASQRNAALAMATGDWVLSVDADERITPAMSAEIGRVVADRSSPHRGYRVPIRSEILGRRFAFSGTQQDYPLRLFRRDSGRWVGRVHEVVQLEGTAGTLRGELRHRTIPSMSAFLGKIDRYTTLEAEGLAERQQPSRSVNLTVRPAWTFFKLYVLKQGFRDGLEGFMFSLFSGVSAAVRAWKHRELTLARRAT